MGLGNNYFSFTGPIFKTKKFSLVRSFPNYLARFRDKFPKKKLDFVLQLLIFHILRESQRNCFIAIKSIFDQILKK